MAKKRNYMGTYRRILKIDRLLSSGRHWKSEELLKHIADEDREEFSIATLKRDLERMRIDFNAPIQYSKAKDNEGFYYTESTYRLPALFTTEGDMVSLEIMKQLVSSDMGDLPFGTDAIRMMDSMTTPIENPLMDRSDPVGWMKDRIVVLGNNAAEINPEVLKTICSSIKGNRELSFLYRGVWNPERLRHVRPYQLLFWDGLWSLYAWDIECEGTRIFPLYRIREPEVLSTVFRYNPEDDYRRRTSGSFGIYTSEKEYTFRLHLWDESAEIARDRFWGKDQQVTELDDGYAGIELTFRSNQYHPIFRWVMGCGSECIPVEPQELVDDWKKDVEKVHGYIGVYI